MHDSSAIASRNLASAAASQAPPAAAKKAAPAKAGAKDGAQARLKSAAPAPTMNAFASGHATHPDWRMALSMAAAQVDAQLARHDAAPTLGFVYFCDHYAGHAQALLAALHQRWPGMAWVGSVGVGVLASGVEYFDEPALALLLTGLPRDAVPRLFGRAAAVGLRRVQCAGACRPGHARPGRAAARVEPAHRIRLPVRRRGGVAPGAAAMSPTACCKARCRAWPSRRTWRWCRASRRAASRSGRRGASPRPSTTGCHAGRRARAALPAARPGRHAGRAAHGCCPGCAARWSG